MAVLLAVDHDLVGVRERGRIAVGGGERQQHHVAGLDGAAADGGFLHHLARHGHGRIGAQQLLDRGRHQFRLRDQPFAIGRCFRQVPERGADRAPGGVDTGDQKQPQRAQHVAVGQRLAVLVLGVHQRRNQIVGLVRLAVLDMPGEIAAHLVDRTHQRVIVLDAEFEDFVDPFDEEVRVLLGDAEHVGDGAHRNVLGVARRRVAFAVGDEFVDQLVADGANPRLQFLHGVGRERRQQQLLRRLVFRRVGGDRRRNAGLLRPHVAHDDAARGEMFGVVGDFPDRLVGGRQIAAEETVGVNHRRYGAQFVPDRKGIFSPARIGMVEIAYPVLDGRMFGQRAGGIGHQGGSSGSFA